VVGLCLVLPLNVLQLLSERKRQQIIVQQRGRKKLTRQDGYVPRMLRRLLVLEAVFQGIRLVALFDVSDAALIVYDAAANNCSAILVGEWMFVEINFFFALFFCLSCCCCG